MMRLLIRGITLICLLIGMGVYTGMNSIPLIVGVVSLCAWLSICDIKDVEGWIVVYAACVSLGWYDQWGVIFLAMIVAGYLFSVAHTQLMRSHNDNIVMLFISAFFIGVVVQMITDLIYTRHLGYDVQHYTTTIFVSLITFLIFAWLLQKSERFIELYIQDKRGHT